ncbi:hypothetical protein TCON_0542 [Astathelohania contejeani]|uniref:Uncharacterized protein n=1 Tax=Astathelohania contejeani TaxID=164912 RepID=A0ABQ7I1G2_9MICR|nr:hypothetical protein TCON_0542 [Thelohania contejeani]
MTDSSDYSSNSIDFQIISNENEIENIIFLFKSISIYEDLITFLTNIASYLHRAVSGEITLSMVGIVNLSKIESLFIKKIRDEINKLTYRHEDINAIISRRVFNCPLDITLELYKKLELNSKYYLFISQLRLLDAEDVECFSEMYNEYNIENIRRFPLNSEEIFLLDDNLYNMVINIGNQRYRIVLLDKKQFIKFIKKYEIEIK